MKNTILTIALFFSFICATSAMTHEDFVQQERIRVWQQANDEFVWTIVPMFGVAALGFLGMIVIGILGDIAESKERKKLEKK